MQPDTIINELIGKLINILMTSFPRTEKILDFLTFSLVVAVCPQSVSPQRLALASYGLLFFVGWHVFSLIL